jgi:hypothetical protein
VGRFVIQDSEFAMLSNALMLLMPLGVLMALSSLWVAIRHQGRWLPQAMAAQTLVLLALVPYLVLPAVNAFKGASDFCAPVRALSEAGLPYRLYSVGFTREEYVFYAEKFHEPVFTDIIPLEGLEDADPIEMAMLQIKARKLIAQSVEDVPVANMESVTEPERAALRAAIEAAIDETGDKAFALRLFEGALTKALDAFIADFSGPEPAFMFVQDEDWRWMLPLLTTAPSFAILKHEPVGSRYVLLFANAAGAALAAGTP